MNAHDLLANTDDERAAARALAAATQVPEMARAYVERPFAFPTASRFSDGTFGVLYSADSLQTAFRESGFHLGRFYADCGAPPMMLRRMQLAFRLAGTIEDIRRAAARTSPKLYLPDDYRFAQRFGAELHDSSKSMGIHYDSVRRPDGGHCYAAFTPRLVRSAEVTGEVALAWDGTRFSEGFAIGTGAR